MKEVLKVKGMTCSNCALSIEKKLSNVKGVISAKVSLIQEELLVEYLPEIIGIADIISKVNSLGYKAYLDGEICEKKPFFTLKNRFLISIFILVVLMYFSMGHMISAPLPDIKISLIIQAVLALLIMLINHKFFVSGVKAVINLSPNMDTLVSLGSIAAFIYSAVEMVLIFLGREFTHVFFESAGMVLTLVTLGKWLEDISKRKTGREVEKLSERVPDSVTILVHGEEKVIKNSDLKVGDVVVLKMGDYVSVDGKVVLGEGSIDKSAITGESIPEEVTVSSKVVSGSIVNSGYLLVRAEKVGKETLFSKIVDIVKSAGASKSPAQKYADKVAKIFVPTVTALAVLTFILWFSFTSDLYRAFNFAISVLVVSCPCALGLATPVAVMAGTGKGASLGVLYKNAETMQKTGDINLILLDKTATLTVGKPEVVDFINYSNMKSEDIKNIASSLEEKSSHPLGKSIIEFCGKGEAEVLDYSYIVGQGMIATIGGVKYYLGNERLLEENGVKINEKHEGYTAVYFASEVSVIAVFLISDKIKETSKSAIENLKKLGVKSVMLTGDNNSVASAVAKELLIDEYIAEVLPDGKAQVVNEYKEKGYYVAMAGDGINDSPALKSAEVGIAVGNGTDIAIESSDMVLAGSNIESIADAIALSRKTVKVIKGNLFWAFIYNALAIPIAAGVLSFIGINFTPAIASICMCASSLFVVFNALRIRRFKPLSKREKEKVKTGKKKMLIGVDKMMCLHCASKVENSLKEIDGVKKVKVNLDKKEVLIKGDFLTEEKVKLAVEKVGFIYLGEKSL